MVASVQEFITTHLGAEFIDPPTFDLASSYKDSSVSTPLIFILSPGTDPTGDFLKFAEEMKFGKKHDMVSLGQGQGNKAGIYHSILPPKLILIPRTYDN